MTETNDPRALARTRDDTTIAVRNAVALWSDATTNPASPRRQDLLRDKQRAVLAFFRHAGKHPGDVTPMDVKGWQKTLEDKGLAVATVYARVCHLSSFYTWAMRDTSLGRFINSNPALLAHPKAPKAYQTESVKSLTNDQLRTLLAHVRAKANAGELTGKRDYALLLLYVATGMRRGEVIGLRGGDVEVGQESLVIRSRVKGGDYLGREVSDPSVRDALHDYLKASGRLDALKTNSPIWTRHDYAGRPGAALSSHSFVENLKRYARAAGVGDIHLHQTRHTYARMVAESTGSITETQDALGHRNVATTRVYVQRIAVKRDKHSQNIIGLLDLSANE